MNQKNKSQISNLKSFIATLLVLLLLPTLASAQDKPTTRPAATQPAPKKLKFLNGTYLWRSPPGLGMGLQDGQLLTINSGQVRNWDGSVVSARPMLEPNLDLNVLAAALRKHPKGGWAILDAEAAESYQVHENQPHEQNVKGFARWQAYIKAVKTLRPDLKVAPILIWHPPDGANYNIQSNWAECDACTAIFKESILPLIDALAIEYYYIDWPSPPAPNPGGDMLFNKIGSNDLRYGFRDHIHAQYNWARAMSGKPPIHVLSICPQYPGRKETEEKFMTGAQMAECLDLIAMYEPAAVMLWGSAVYSKNHKKLPGNLTIGEWDPSAEWVAEVKKRVAEEK